MHCRENLLIEVKAKETDGSIDLKTQTQIEDFLNTFFKLYPQASARSLSIM